MAVSTDSGFIYLNQANDWPIPESDNLAEVDGVLCLEDTNFERGLFIAGPFEVSEHTTRWHRLRVEADPLPAGCHIQLCTLTIEDDNAPPWNPNAEQPFQEQSGWRVIPRNIFDALILNEPARYLWIGGVLRPGETESPRIHQIRVDYGRDGYLNHLPAIYSRDPVQADFLDRHLALDESVLGGLRDAIGDLPELFDALTAPSADFPSWLSWLAGWQAFELSELWQEEDSRRYLGEAFELQGKRGTLEGLRRYLKLYAGVEARIEEPALHMHLWTLGETSTLGFTTMLAPAHLQGAVLGSTATLNESHLTQGDTLGQGLFEDLAHHFCVYVYCADLVRSDALDDVHAVLEREKPAHTTYDLCVVEPALRVGYQARVGIDAIVAEGPPSARLGLPLGAGVLAAEQPPCPDDNALYVNEEYN